MKLIRKSIPVFLLNLFAIGCFCVIIFHPFAVKEANDPGFARWSSAEIRYGMMYSVAFFIGLAVAAFVLAVILSAIDTKFEIINRDDSSYGRKKICYVLNFIACSIAPLSLILTILGFILRPLGGGKLTVYPHKIVSMYSLIANEGAVWSKQYDSIYLIVVMICLAVMIGSLILSGGIVYAAKLFVFLLINVVWRLFKLAVVSLWKVLKIFINVCFAIPIFGPLGIIFVIIGIIMMTPLYLIFCVCGLCVAHLILFIPGLLFAFPGLYILLSMSNMPEQIMYHDSSSSEDDEEEDNDDEDDSDDENDDEEEDNDDDDDEEEEKEIKNANPAVISVPQNDTYKEKVVRKKPICCPVCGNQMTISPDNEYFICRTCSKRYKRKAR